MLRAYATLLERWNAKFNLVGRQDIQHLWSRHIEDALFLYRCLPAQTAEPEQPPQWIMDVGTGGGLPGMVLAIADLATASVVPPGSATRRFLLLDRSERKVRFLTQVVAELELPNVVPLCADFTQPLDEAAAGVGKRLANTLPARLPVICARAVAPPSTLWTNLQHLLLPNGELLVAVGPESKQQLPQGVEVQWCADKHSAAQSGAERGVVKLTQKSPDT